jgi:hypothetical protein
VNEGIYDICALIGTIYTRKFENAKGVNDPYPGVIFLSTFNPRFCHIKQHDLVCGV